MTSDRLAVPEPDLAERPTSAAQLKITAQPARVKITARRWLTVLAGAGLITVCGLVWDHAGQRKGAGRREGP